MIAMVPLVMDVLVRVSRKRRKGPIRQQRRRVLPDLVVRCEPGRIVEEGKRPARIAMLRYKLPDIRLLYYSDMRFLSQVSL